MTDRIPFHDAVRAQPRLLETAAAEIAASVRRADLPAWRPGETVAVLAMGASTNSAHALGAALARHGVHGANLTASEYTSAPASFDPGDHYVLVSESGRSPEPIAAARDRWAGRRIAVTNFPDAAIAEVADRTVGYGGIDDSPVYTSGYLATLMSYAALMDAAGLDSGFDVAGAPRLVADALERHASAAESVAGHLAGAAAVDLIGRGFGVAAATQGALMFREALRLPATGWETYQYLHGPLESTVPGTALVVIGDGRELDVVPQMAEAGVRVVVLSAAGEERLAPLERDGVLVVPLAERDGFARAVEETVVLQLVTDAAARLGGIDIAEFVYSQPDTKLPEPEAAGAPAE